MFDWQPILEFLQGRKYQPNSLNSFGYIDAERKTWLEIENETIIATVNGDPVRHVIGFKNARELYLKWKIQPTLFDL